MITERKINIFCISLIVAMFFIAFVDAVRADVNIKFKNKCPDLVGDDWECLNETQAAQSAETISQIKLAVKKTRFRGNLTIVSIDPKRPYRSVWEYGAWLRGKKIYYAAMPDCPNARWELEKLLRRLR